jgi:hypothetical protein
VHIYRLPHNGGQQVHGNTVLAVRCQHANGADVEL